MPGSRKGFEKLNAWQSENFLEFLKIPFYPDGWPVVEVGSLCGEHMRRTRPCAQPNSDGSGLKEVSGMAK